MKFLLRLVVAAFALIGIAYVSNGNLLIIEGQTVTEQFVPAFFAALVLGVANATIGAVAKFLLKALTLPLGCLTLGLSNLVIGLLVNTGIFYLVAKVVDGFSLVDFPATVLAAVMMSVVMALANSVIDRGED
ncbi:MAG: hypothetical protein Kow0056_05370 [Coriobacteriia bacterium]